MIAITFNVFGQEKMLSNILNAETSGKKAKSDANEKKIPKTKQEILNPKFNFSDEKKTWPSRKEKYIALYSTRPNLISIQFGLTFDFLDTYGSNLSLSYERKFNNIPFAWFANYTYGRTFGWEENNSVSNNSDKIRFTYNHLGGGIHYYFLGYDRLFKPYFGVGGFVGFNYFDRDLGVEGLYESSGLDIGGYGLIGIRWCYGLVKCGFEYRFGNMEVNVYDKYKNSPFHELSFLLGFQF
jgi:hypothetical protein